jgi:cation diffusion facilitator CzcD-associated flavoprotein CzcO
VNPGYLEALHRPNVSLKWDAIEGVVENGIKVNTGEIVPLDIIIFGTGFSIVRHKTEVACVPYSAFVGDFRFDNTRQHRIQAV